MWDQQEKEGISFDPLYIFGVLTMGGEGWGGMFFCRYRVNFGSMLTLLFVVYTTVGQPFELKLSIFLNS